MIWRCLVLYVAVTLALPLALTVFWVLAMAIAGPIMGLVRLLRGGNGRQ